MRFVLCRVLVTALPDVPDKVTQHSCEVVAAPCTGGRNLTQLATADDTAEPFALWVVRRSGAAPKRGAVSAGQAS